MKKILVAIALALVLTTIMVLPAFAAVDNAEISVEELLKWNVSGVHYVGKPTTTAPAQDGAIKEGEYTYTYRMVDPVFQCLPYSYSYAVPTDPNADYSSNYIDYYVSYDNEYVYIGIYDNQTKYVGSTVNHFIEFGINTENVMDLIGPSKFGGADGGQLMQRGTSSKTAFYSGTKAQDGQYAPVNGKQIKYVDKTYLAATENGTGGYDVVFEYRFNRADILEIYNGLEKTGYAESPNVFFFSTYRAQYGMNDENYAFFRWSGTKLSNVEKLNLGTDSNYIPAIFVLAEEGSDFLGTGALEIPTKPVETTAPETTEAPTTEAPTTAPETEAPTTEAVVTEAPTTEAPATEAPTTEAPVDEKGCGSSVAAMGIALVAALGTCAVVVSKKKED